MKMRVSSFCSRKRRYEQILNNLLIVYLLAESRGGAICVDYQSL